MSGRSWIFLLGVLIVAGLLVLAGGGGSADSPEHRSDSDGPSGTSALLQYAQALGHPARPRSSSAYPEAGTGLFFIFTPTAEVSADEVAGLRAWLEQGGVLVYANDGSPTRIDTEFKLRRSERLAGGTASGVAPLLPGVNRVSGGATVTVLRPAPDQVVILRGSRGQPLGITQAVGSGRLLALADPLELANLHIDQDDNWRLAAELLALAPSGSAVEFDEFHHGAGAATASPYAIFAFGWAQGLLAAAAVVFVGMALRGRAFGPRLPLTPDAGRPAEEYVNAVGRLLQRARARRLTLEVLLAATRRHVQVQAGLARGGPIADAALERRVPEAAARLAAVESGLAGAAQSDPALLTAARALHELALPRSQTR